MSKAASFRKAEKIYSLTLLADGTLFILYLIFAGAGIGWAKGLTAALCFLLSGTALVLLALSRELLRQRSLWLTCGFGSVALCTLVSLLVRFPAPVG